MFSFATHRPDQERLRAMVTKLDKYSNWFKAISYHKAFYKLRDNKANDIEDFMTEVSSRKNSVKGSPRTPVHDIDIHESEVTDTPMSPIIYTEELLRLQKENDSLREKQHRHNLFMVISLFKGRVRTKLQKAFDMWSEYTRILNKDNLMRHQLLQLRVGLQHVESETSNKKALEDNSIRLQTLLLMTLYFFKWKSTSSLILLNEERDTNNKQNAIIMNEMRSLKEQLTAINQQENTLFQVALARGNDALNVMVHEKHRLSQNILPKK